jgi:hypothetical protein
MPELQSLTNSAKQACAFLQSGRRVLFNLTTLKHFLETEGFLKLMLCTFLTGLKERRFWRTKKPEQESWSDFARARKTLTHNKKL